VPPGAFLRRRAQGFVRECHGDLHLNNIARIDGELVIFDCIEFNSAMRWIDVMSEVAFTVMDLQDRGRADLAHRFLNAYLEQTGDYAGLAVLPFYLAYRALVRAKIARLRAAQLGSGTASARRASSIAGTSHWRAAMRSRLGRTDHHPRTLGLRQDDDFAGLARGGRRDPHPQRRRAQNACMASPRSSSTTPRSRQALCARGEPSQPTIALARWLAKFSAAGRSAIVDATFFGALKREAIPCSGRATRDSVRDCRVRGERATLRERIVRRKADGGDASDADLAVLAHQIAAREPLSP
jgi:hypothetical protein